MKKTTNRIVSKSSFQPALFAQAFKTACCFRKTLSAFIILIVSFSNTGLAQSTFNNVNGNWNDANNWSPVGVPAGNTAIIIPAGDIANMVSGDSYTGSGIITLAGGLSVPTGATFKPIGVVSMTANGASLAAGGTLQLTTLTVNTANATDAVSLTNSS